MRPTRPGSIDWNTNWLRGALHWCARIISVLSLFEARSRQEWPDGYADLGGLGSASQCTESAVGLPGGQPAASDARMCLVVASMIVWDLRSRSGRNSSTTL